MTRRVHLAAILFALAGAIALLVAMVVGKKPLPQWIGIDRSIRDTAVALWGFLVPAWFVIEETWFAPPKDQVEALTKFRDGQQKARVTWMVVGGAVGIVLGLTAPTLSGASSSNPQGTAAPDTAQKSN